MQTLLFETTKPNLSDSNNVLPSDRAFHEWYRFVLSFPPHLVRHYVTEFGLGADDLLLDPFCGTGTTVVEGKLLGIPSAGIEASPFSHFVGSVKTNWAISASELLAASTAIHHRAIDELMPITDLPDAGNPSAELMSLSPELQQLMVTNSISPLPLHKAIILLNRIDLDASAHSRDYLRLALAKTLVKHASNLRFGPEVGVGEIKHDAPVMGPWLREVKHMGRDLEQARSDTPVEVLCHDARNVSQVLKANSVSAVITSPPYPNEKDYTRAIRLESVLLGFLTSKKDLRLWKERLLSSNTRTAYRNNHDHEHVKDFESIHSLSEHIESRRIELGKTSGFERMYARVTALYFGGMYRHLADLRQVLRPGAHLAYVVGDQASFFRIMIRTADLLAEIAASLGYEVVRKDLFRTRFSTATREQLNEEVLILKYHA